MTDDRFTQGAHYDLGTCSAPPSTSSRATITFFGAGPSASSSQLVVEVEPDDELSAALVREGFALDAGEDVIVARELTAAGKSSARVNGQPATSAQLRSLGETIVDFVGQHEHQRLFSAIYQTDIVDRFAGSKALALRAAVADQHGRLAVAQRELAALEEQTGRADRDAEFARFALAEIDAARLGDDDDEDRLRERRDYLANVERIAAAVTAANRALSAGDASAIEALGTAAAALAVVSRYSSELARLHESVAALQSDANDAAAALAGALDATDYDAAEADQVGARLDAIERLKRKYGGTVASIRIAREGFAATLAGYESRDERGAQLRTERAALASGLERDAARLGELRTKAAGELEAGVNAELEALAMRGGRFGVAFERLDATGPRGREAVQFVLSAHRGEPVRPLVKVASGGELSRVVLAVTVVLADRREASTLIFDEIDAGIGGVAATAVGQRLGALARTTQVLCVTHLAQIAAWGDDHFSLNKVESGRTARIAVAALDDASAVRAELARMLSGSATTVALEHADQLLGDARRRKGRKLRSA